MANPPRNKLLLARRAWQQMFNLLMRTAPDRTGILGRYGLTPNDARGLSTLDIHRGRSMRSLAKEWNCDASNVTWIVDRLERMGLAERRPVPNDRRLKHVALTANGLKMRAELLEAFYNPPAELADLTVSQLKVLDRILRQVSPHRPGTTGRDQG